VYLGIATARRVRPAASLNADVFSEEADAIMIENAAARLLAAADRSLP
jgi:hypothetical protein